ncbi:MAG: endonuclease/exonuclease/phosphatase family protein [Treponema sp.]|jgi:endonuclease/exonuclease/phosphatase family metal-dependent hydrolase|nr:endonuclease/exonuclease/phosphatase family protein [Treponema sp.]
MKKKISLFFAILFLFVFGLNSQERAPDTIKIMSFNIQIFGVSKMAKPEVVAILVDIVSGADIIAVQEVRSFTIDPVEQFMSMLPDTYKYVIGPRQGRSGSKEQYWVIYDSAKITVLEEDSWPDENDIFERSPYAVYFKTKGAFDFILVNNHIQPRAAEKEIRALPRVVTYYADLWKDPDVLVMGDFNADGQYFDSSLLNSIFPETEYKIIFTDEDTTLAQSHNTYDRFIITNSAVEDFTGSFGVIRFDEVYNFDDYSISPRNVSDHYPIWADFWINRE